MKNVILYLIGNPGIGKFTIAEKIKEKEEFTLIDNHSYTNAIFSISQDFNNPKHELYRMKVRDVVYDAIVDLCPKEQSFIFTNVIFKGEEELCMNPLQELANKKRALFVPILLKCDKNENKKRIVNPFRAKKLKTTNPNVLENIEEPQISHKNIKELDITNLSADEVAQNIINHIIEIQKKEKCVLCDGVSNDFDNIKSFYPKLSTSVVLFETNNFKIIPDKFPLSENHIIILPKKHINTFSEFNLTQNKELEGILNKLQKTTNAENFIMFEHGTSKKEEFNTPAHIKSIFHAHLHFIPNVKCVSEDLKSFFESKNVNIINDDNEVLRIEDFKSEYKSNNSLLPFLKDNVLFEDKERNSVESYFYIKNSDNSQLFIPERFINPQIPSQFLREALNQRCNTSEWNWKLPMSKEAKQEYAKRILRMVKVFNQGQNQTNNGNFLHNIGR